MPRPRFPDSDLDLHQLSEKLTAIRKSADLAPAAPPTGWLKLIRQTLGMRTAQLAKRLGVSQPNVVRAEEREAAGAISIATLRRFASEMDCEFVYFLLPRTSLKEMVERQAEKVARAESAAVAHTLGLEWQVVPPPALVEEIEKQKAKLVIQRPARLWELAEGE